MTIPICFDCFQGFSSQVFSHLLVIVLAYFFIQSDRNILQPLLSCLRLAVLIFIEPDIAADPATLHLRFDDV